MHDFILALMGGALLGIATVGYLYVHGRIAGISGLVEQFLSPKTVWNTPAFWFIAGLITVPFIYGSILQPKIEIQASALMMVIAGLIYPLWHGRLCNHLHSVYQSLPKNHLQPALPSLLLRIKIANS